MTDPSELPGVARALVGFRELAKKHDRAIILTHDNPDPDAMASAAGIGALLRELGGVKSILAYGGIIGRAENRELVRVLRLPMTPVGRVDLEDPDSLIVIVDTQFAAGNHSCPQTRPPDAVIDHHPARPGNKDLPLAYVEAEYGATSSMVAALLREADITPEPELATALFYGVKSDTRSLGRESERADTEAYQWLFPLSDQSLLAQIEHPQVPLSYFRAYHTAFEKARIYHNVIAVDLGEVYTPDIVPEIAERLVSLEGAKWSVALGSFEDELYVSVRTNDRRMNAGKQIQALTADLGGSAGGHGQMAGGRIPLGKKGRALRAKLVRRFLENCGVGDAAGKHIV